MKSLAFVLCVLFTVPAFAQEQPFRDSLLDHMVGHWVLKGTIAGQQTTHDVDIGWVLQHRYIQIHEVSREKDSTGNAQYEAIVYFGWNFKTSEYAVLWLDITGTSTFTPIGFGKRSGNDIPLLFKMNDGDVFHTTFMFDEATDTWQWKMDGEKDGKLVPFARVRLQRK